MTTTYARTDKPTLDTQVHPLTIGRRVAGLAMMVAVVARVASIFLWPPDSDASHARMLNTAAAHHSAWTAATAAETVAWLAAGSALLASVALGAVAAAGRHASPVGGPVSR